MADPSQRNVFEGGKQQFDDDAVEVRTGVKYSVVSQPIPSSTATCKDCRKIDSGIHDGITIKVKCKKNPHVVQFIYREDLDANGKPIRGSIDNGVGGSYDMTTDAAHPVWNTDSATKPNPYYEGKGIHRSDPDSLTTLDEPTVKPDPNETMRATFKSYVICDGKVIREVSWVREQKSGSDPTYSTVTVTKADKLPDWATDKLKDQGYDNVP